MEFCTENEAYDFYNAYARGKGLKYLKEQFT